MDIMTISIKEEKIFIDVEQQKPSLEVARTTIATATGVRLTYDGSFNYDTSGYYYDKWYSASDDLTQGELPKMTAGGENVRINVGSDKPSIKVLE